jgi:small subunit ribosomal protein S20
MANSKQSLKRAKQNAETYKLRHAQRSMVLTAFNAVRARIYEHDSAKAKEALTRAEKVLDSSASKKVIHKNAAARTKSRLSKAVKALG